MKKILYLIALIMAASAAVAFAARPESARKDDFSRKLRTFNAVVKELQANYVDTLDANELMDKTIGGLLYQIDPYTEYYPAGDQDEILSISQGQYAGIGSTIVKHKGQILISEPQWDSPARRTGLRPGDIILAVDGDTVRPSSQTADVSKRLRGQAGTVVRVDVKRPYTSDSLLTFEITRDEIKVNPLPYFGVDTAGVGYIRLTTFNESSARKVKEAVTEMLRNPALKGIVLDLRGNGGGLLESAVQIVGNFVPKGTEVVRTRGRNNASEKIYKTTRQPLDTKIPLAVLIDEGTASASEIVSGSLQDLDRAVIVGQRSYGKGLVQTTRPLPFDDLMKLTTGRYYIPSGRLIQALDYSHRNPDGSPARTPDSLTTEFRTRAGRIVRDGGGITPDIAIEAKEMNRLIYNIVADMWAFDFANRFHAANPALVPGDDFVVSDSIFAQFKASIDPAEFKYDRQCETGLDYLRRAAREEGYMTDSVAAQFDILAGMLRHDLNHDLDLNAAEIKEILADEILSRYVDEGQCVRAALPSDTVYLRAAALFAQPAEYKRLLQAQ